MVKCPLCSREVKEFYRKPQSGFLMCPECKRGFRRKYYPDLEQYAKDVQNYPWEESGNPSSQSNNSEENNEQESKVKPKRPELFPTPKPPEEIIAEVLEEWGCDEAFINAVTRYVQRKGFLDPGWLLNMLLEARTGRKFSQQEAFMVVDEIVSEIQAEKEKAEKSGRQYFFSVMPFGRTPQSTYTSYGSPIPLTSPEERIYFRSSASTTTYPSTFQYSPQYTSQYPSATPTQPILTREEIAKMIQEAFNQKRTDDKVEALVQKVADIEKQRIQDKAELEKTLSQIISSLREEIRNTITSSLPQQPQKSEDTITKKDLELMLERRDKDFMQKLFDIEKKYLESKSESEKQTLLKEISELRKDAEDLKREIESFRNRQPTVVSPEGWQKDETRLVAQLGTEALNILKDRRPIEYLVRIVAQPKAEVPKEVIKTEGEKGLVDLIKEMGGAVE